MARIKVNSIQKVELDKPREHDKVSATYSVFNVDGKKYVQIDTYGKDNRLRMQSIQIDRECAEFLVKLLGNEFDLLEK